MQESGRDLSALALDLVEWHRACSKRSVLTSQATITRNKFTTFDVSPIPIDNQRITSSTCFEKMIAVTHLSPQSSHSSTGFHPNHLWYKSHAVTNPLEKKKIKRTPACLRGPLTCLFVIPCGTPVGIFFPDAPGLDERTPVAHHRRLFRADRRSASVAAAIDGEFWMEDDRAVWND